jgi:hypothetical protein
MRWIIMRESDNGFEVEVEEHNNEADAKRRLDELRRADHFNYYYLEQR